MTNLTNTQHIPKPKKSEQVMNSGTKLGGFQDTSRHATHWYVVVLLTVVVDIDELWQVRHTDSQVVVTLAVFACNLDVEVIGLNLCGGESGC